MGFERRTFSDGDIEFDVPRWRKVIESLNMNEVRQTSSEYLDSDRKSTNKEVMLKTKESGSYIRLKENGDIDIFSEFGTGLRLTDGALQLYADNVILVSKLLELHTTPNGFLSNGEVMNKEGINSFPKRKGKTELLKKMIEEMEE